MSELIERAEYMEGALEMARAQARPHERSIRRISASESSDMPQLIERAEYMAGALEMARAHLRKLRGILEVSGSEQAQELAFLALMAVADALAKWDGTGGGD